MTGRSARQAIVRAAPPRIARWFLRLFARLEVPSYEIVNHLDRQYEDRVGKRLHPRRAIDRWYVAEVFRTIPALVDEHVKSYGFFLSKRFVPLVFLVVILSGLHGVGRITNPFIAFFAYAGVAFALFAFTVWLIIQDENDGGVSRTQFRASVVVIALAWTIVELRHPHIGAVLVVAFNGAGVWWGYLFRSVLDMDWRDSRLDEFARWRAPAGNGR